MSAPNSFVEQLAANCGRYAVAVSCRHDLLNHGIALKSRSLRNLSALVRNYGDVFGGASGRRCESLLFDFGEESS